MVALTEDLALSRARAESMEAIKSLNLWGNGLTEVGILERAKNVEVLSLSVNDISTLEPFKGCLSLRELYLRKNRICDLADLNYLLLLKELRILWLSDNPCAEVDNYRLKVISVLPQLSKLDNKDISEEERQEAIKYKVEAEKLMGKEKAAESTSSTNGRISNSEAEPSPAPPRQEEKRNSNPSDDLIRRPSSSILYAVMALIGDLDLESLRIVQSEVDQNIAEALSNCIPNR